MANMAVEDAMSIVVDLVEAQEALFDATSSINKDTDEIKQFRKLLGQSELADAWCTLWAVGRSEGDDVFLIKMGDTAYKIMCGEEIKD